MNLLYAAIVVAMLIVGSFVLGASVMWSLESKVPRGSQCGWCSRGI